MLNILIPLAGRGRRFTEAGYKIPKPLIDVNGKTMIQRVIENVRPSQKHRFIFMVLMDHLKGGLLGFYGSPMVVVPDVTEGAACTALMAKHHIDNEDPLMICNSDQILDWDVDRFLDQAESFDGCIATFAANDPKWSFVLRNGPWVVEVVEKKAVSDEATCGIYYWKRGRDFVRSAEQMIAKDIRTNGEFYIAPVYNELIAAGGRVTTYRIPTEAMHGLGTPEDLQTYLGLRASVAA